jgi:hypothetical protein
LGIPRDEEEEEYSPKREIRTEIENTLDGGARNGTISSAQYPPHLHPSSNITMQSNYIKRYIFYQYNKKAK